MESNNAPAVQDAAPSANGRVARNIVIFSDGTGQDGGVHPEQRLSNVYKLYRAARIGPDNDIDPSKQVAFYDPGLGTDTSATGVTSVHRKITKLLSSATGRGITTNIADCYEFIINHYRPGDRIYLVGFSRGAYTIRCIANVLMWCGVPTRDGTEELPRFRSRIREIAEKAVIRVYEHGAGHPRDKFEEERCELARRFREEFGSGTAGKANAAPYFIGAFDTVASLGAKGPLQVVLEVLVAALVLTIASVIAAMLSWITGLGWFEALLISVTAVGLWALYSYLRTALKVMWPPLPGRWPRMHIAQWSGRNFDRLLSKDVCYARHAISIDENRDDFPRLKWGWGKEVVRPVEIEGEARPFIQLWFAGNHSDIGGSYPEVESRLSDITLGWMIEEAESLPRPLLLNGRALHLFPSPAGLQHDEVAGMSDTIRGRTPALMRWLTKKWTWKILYRDPVNDAPLHESVGERFALPAVPKQAGAGPYRPEALREHERFKTVYI
jgi:uncharacterized protein (DUF2235 family)